MADNGGMVVVVVVVEGLRGRGARKRFTLGTPTRAGFATRHNGTRPINRLWPRFIVLAWVRCQEITARWKHARGEPRLPPSCRFLLLRYSLRFLFLRLFFFFFLLVFEERGGSMGRRDCGLGLRFFRVGV